jgi:hypothetical protein
MADYPPWDDYKDLLNQDIDLAVITTIMIIRDDLPGRK